MSALGVCVLLGGHAAGPSLAASNPFVAAGDSDTCALMPSDGSVWCWGLNNSGQMGPNNPGAKKVPNKVTELPAAASLTVGAHHECIIDTGQRVWCWGSNSFGELGNGHMSVKGAPTVIGGLAATQVAAGDGFTCAITPAKTVDCWGDNNFGELGDGNTNDASTPQPVMNLKNVVQIAAGYFHACALLTTAKIKCWGDNSNGQLGIGSTTPSDVPVGTEFSNATSIAAGDSDTCAISTAGALSCWGANLDNQLGTGTPGDQWLPTPVSGLSSGVSQVTMGQSHTCAIATIVLCWGDPTNGKVGNGQYKSSPPTPIPTPVFGLIPPPTGGVGASQIGAGFDHTCAVLGAGQLKCWGNGDSGALGDGTTEDQALPTLVVGLPETGTFIDGISAGEGTGCAINAGLTLECWGIDTGNGDTSEHDSAVGNLQGQVVAVSTYAGGCSLTVAGTVNCWGADSFGELGNGTKSKTPTGTPSAVTGLTNVQQISYAGPHACALLKQGNVDCWGANGSGELGDGSTSERNSPVAVAGLPGAATQVAAGSGFTCALLKNQQVWCWGEGNQGELGNSSFSDSSTPVRVKGIADGVQIAAGNAAACVLESAGAVQCWGFDHDGELGNNSTTNSDVPVPVSGLSTGVAQITESDVNGCALMAGSGAVQCWGEDDDGELGDGSFSTTPSLIPVGVMGASSGILAISAAGQAFSECAIATTNQAECWGGGLSGQLGAGSPPMNSDVPVAVTGL